MKERKVKNSENS